MDTTLRKVLAAARRAAGRGRGVTRGPRRARHGTHDRRPRRRARPVRGAARPGDRRPGPRRRGGSCARWPAAAPPPSRSRPVTPSTSFGPQRQRRASPLLVVRPDVRWERLESLARDVLDSGGDPAEDGPGDLFSLAQTVALLTHGIVSIEDTASRVLAYSRSDSDAAQVDELRRLSILGWQGPPDYLRMLREWGVFDRLRTGEEVVHVDEHADLGVRRRLAVGIHAGQRQLGTIWVQEGATPFAERAADVLLGAARVAAGHLIRRRSRETPGARWSRELVTGLLDGRTDPGLVAGVFGLAERTTALVVAFAVRDRGSFRPGTRAPTSSAWRAHRRRLGARRDLPPGRAHRVARRPGLRRAARRRRGTVRSRALAHVQRGGGDDAAPRRRARAGRDRLGGGRARRRGDVTRGGRPGARRDAGRPRRPDRRRVLRPAGGGAAQPDPRPAGGAAPTCAIRR